MKKSFVLRRVVVSTMAMAALLSMTAIAADKTTEATITATEINDTAEKFETKYQLVKGIIQSIEKKDGFTTISVSNDDMGMVFHVEDNVFVIDQKDGSYKKVSDLEKGMSITAVLDNNSPMTMSLPPQTPGAAGFVINDEKGFMDISVYNDELVNKSNSLKLNIGEDTKIVDIKGTKKAYTAEDLKNAEILVLYTTTTRSIPAQTTPSIVMVLDNDELTGGSNTTAPKPEEDKAETTFGLREVAESTGYVIKWAGNNKPVALEKGNVKIEITIGSKICSINGVNTQLEKAPILENEKMVVTDEIKSILEKYSLEK